MQLIDSHCHLDFEQFDADLNQVITNANKLGITSFVVPGVSVKHWPKQIQLATSYKNVHCAFGIHPWFIDGSYVGDQGLSALEILLQTQTCVGVGECGLDATIDNMPLQQQLFKAQIKLANRYNKPLIIHHRKSHHIIHQCFKQVIPEHGGVIHAFSGSVQDAKKYIELGFKLGIGGGVTYDRANKTRSTILQVGLNNIVLETDSPDMPLFGNQGKRNEPKYILEVAKKLADLFSCTVEEVADVTTNNTKSTFAI